ncbi:MAG: hypothetical protein HN509_03155 [Halobacteriovoraceae bacterium]|nr:hypothetical protein [Halobacteriovoraceae bacterium]MBT5093580.1 hypothetical protein [Halobacteriovoraceae bacterium]
MKKKEKNSKTPTRKSPEEELDRFRKSRVFACIFYASFVFISYLFYAGIWWSYGIEIGMAAACIPLLTLFAASKWLGKWQRRLNQRGVFFFCLFFAISGIVSAIVLWSEVYSN